MSVNVVWKSRWVIEIGCKSVVNKNYVRDSDKKLEEDIAVFNIELIYDLLIEQMNKVEGSRKSFY